MVFVGWSAACLIHCSLLNPAELITSEKYAQNINELHRKLERFESALVNRMRTVFLHDSAWLYVAHPTLQKSNKNWAIKFWLVWHVQLTSCQPAGGRKCFPRVHRIPEHGFLCYRNKQSYFLLEKVLIVIVPILTNKDVFDPMIGPLVAQTGRNLPALQDTQVWYLAWADPLEKEVPAHSISFAGRIFWTEEPMGSQRIGHGCATNTWS